MIRLNIKRPLKLTGKNTFKPKNHMKADMEKLKRKNPKNKLPNKIKQEND